MKRYLNKGILALVITLAINTPLCAFADSTKIMSIGDDLTQEQKIEMMHSLTPKSDECEVITVTNKDERDALLGIVPEVQIGTKTLSCAFVEPMDTGSGISIDTHNLTWVSKEMLKNALITAGVTDVHVIADAPYPVSGTGALTGIMMCYEKSTGEELSADKKKAANQELVATGKLVENNDAITNDTASALVNDIKKEVIEDKPKSDREIGQIVNNISNTYDANLSSEDKQMLVNVMSKINSIEYDTKEMSKTLNDMSTLMKKQLEETGKVIEEMGILDKIYAKLCEIGNSITSLFYKLKGENMNFDGITYDAEGNIINEGNPFITGETKSIEEVRELTKTREVTASEVDVTESQNNLEDEIDSENKVDSSTADKIIGADGKIKQTK